MWPRVLTTIVFLCGSVTLADELSIKEDPGFEVFRDQCMACHLQTGLGIEAMNAPSIAGLPRWYVTDQLRKFRSDQRGRLVVYLEGMAGRSGNAFLGTWPLDVPKLFDDVLGNHAAADSLHAAAAGSGSNTDVSVGSLVELAAGTGDL